MKTLKKIDSGAEYQRICGAILGCMIGNALGLPASSMAEEDARLTVGKITGYIVNFKSPFFYFLKKGQYGSDMRFLIETLEQVSTHGGYDNAAVRDAYHAIAIKSRSDLMYARSTGRNILRALLSGKPCYSHSMTCVWGCVPLVLLSRTWEQARSLVLKQAHITHTSEVSLAATDILSYALFRVKSGDRDLREVFGAAMTFVEKEYEYEAVSVLTDKINNVLDGKYADFDAAKRGIGTDSSAPQSIPLAIYILVSMGQEFRKAVIVAANIHSINTPEERRMREMQSTFDSIVAITGGASMVIGALVGLFLGARDGLGAIPAEFTGPLEDYAKVIRLLSRFESPVTR